jgi:hypothetical protein
LPNPDSFQAITLALASYVVAYQALRGFQQFTRFSMMFGEMAFVAVNLLAISSRLASSGLL